MAFIVGKKDRMSEASGQAAAAVSQAVAGEMMSVAGERGETVRISFRMGRDLHTRLKLAAVRQGRSIVSMLEGFVTEHTPAM